MDRRRIADSWRIPDELWERLEPLLPKVRRSKKGGRPPVPFRQVMDGIFYSSADRLPVEGGSRRARFGQHVASAFSTVGSSGCLPQTVEGGVAGV